MVWYLLSLYRPQCPMSTLTEHERPCRRELTVHGGRDTKNSAAGEPGQILSPVRAPHPRTAPWRLEGAVRREAHGLGDQGRHRLSRRPHAAGGASAGGGARDDRRR